MIIKTTPQEIIICDTIAEFNTLTNIPNGIRIICKENEKAFVRINSTLVDLTASGGSFTGTLDDITTGATNVHLTNTLKGVYDGLATNSHAPGSDNQDLSGKVNVIAGKGLSTNDYTTVEQTKLSGIAAGANNYTHPANHAPSVITQDVSNRFVTDTEKGTWNGKEAGNANIQTHIASAHAPAGAEVNVNADWNSSAGDSQILNKPTISGTNTGDNINFAPPLGVDDNYATDAEKIKLASLSGTNTGDQSAIANATLATMLTKTYKGNTTAGTATPADVPIATLKTDLILVKADVGLGSVDNTADSGKPISTAGQTALNLKSNLNSPTFTGTVVFPAGQALVTPALGAATGTSLTTTGSQLSSGGGFGYTTGAGGTVIQATSRATGVTLSKLCGNITMFSAAVLTQATSSFVLTNTFIAATDTVIVYHISATNGGAWNFSVVPAAGSCTIIVRNITAASITEATPLRFAVIKGVTA